jgi:ankyrin repeat protein
LNVSALDKLGNTPLHVAALSGNLNILRKLIDEGAKLDSTNMVLMFRCLLTRGQKFKVQKNGKPKPIKKILVDH